MSKTDELPDSFDLRSLRLLKVLIETRSVTEAGKLLSISQPAASRMLAGLRRTLGDPLIVRGRRGSMLTVRAEALKPKIDASLQALSELLESDVFRPEKVQRTVRIATTDHGALVVLGELAEALSASAPGLILEAVPWGAQTLEELETLRLDLALDGESILPENFCFKLLYKERYVCLVRKGHPLLNAVRPDGCIEFRKAAAYPQVVILCPHGDRLERDAVLEKLGRPPDRSVVRTPYFASAPLLLQGTDRVALLPSRLGELITRDGPFALIPLRERTEFRYRLVWHERSQRDPCLQWLREQIYILLSGKRSAAAHS